MTPKQRRDRLFKIKPNVRPFTEHDFRWLWAAHKESKGELTKDEFLEKSLNNLSNYDDAFILEDTNKKVSKSGFGAVGLIIAKFDGWKMEPHVLWFPWTTTRNKVRTMISFFMFVRYSSNIGICVVHSSIKHMKFFNKIKRFAPLYKGGKIPYGDITGDDYLFYVRGKMSGEQHVIH